MSHAYDRQDEILRALRWEAVPEGLPEFHNGDSALGAAQRRIDLFGSLGELPRLAVVPHVDGQRLEVTTGPTSHRSDTAHRWTA